MVTEGQGPHPRRPYRGRVYPRCQPRPQPPATATTWLVSSAAFTMAAPLMRPAQPLPRRQWQQQVMLAFGFSEHQRWKQAALMEHDVRVRRALDDGLVDSAVDRSRWSSSVISWKSCCRATISASQFCAMLRNSAGFVAGAAIPHDKAAPHGAQSGHVNGFAHGIPQTAGAGAASLLVFHLHQTAWPKRLCG